MITYERSMISFWCNRSRLSCMLIDDIGFCWSKSVYVCFGEANGRVGFGLTGVDAVWFDNSQYPRMQRSSELEGHGHCILLPKMVFCIWEGNGRVALGSGVVPVCPTCFSKRKKMLKRLCEGLIWYLLCIYVHYILWITCRLWCCI